MNTLSKLQKEFLDWEFGVFFHFGIRTFYPGHEDWDNIPMPVEGFNPTELDCNDWIKKAKSAGAKYAIMTTKHHDGFALWPTKFSSYNVSETPWKNGQGDVVKEFTDACRKNDIKVGLYYSPAQWGESAVSFANAKDYDDYFINQITELLTNYGKIDYLWFDGCGSEGHEYDKKRIVDVMHKLQPEMLTFCDPEWTPSIRWIGNEDGYASLDNPLLVSSVDFSMLAKEKEKLSEAAVLPAECDCKIRDTWFYDDNEDTIKSLDELFGMYEMSVGHGSNFLLNIGPDRRGLLPEADSKRLSELGDRIREVYDTPVKSGELINRIVLKEDLSEGQKITGFKVYAYLPTYSSQKILVYMGTTVGHKLICPIGAIKASKIEVELEGGEGRLESVKGYYTRRQI